MKTNYINSTTRTYEQNGSFVAVAINATWKHDINCHMDSATHYYCLVDIWEPDNQTSIVSPEKLAQLIAEA